MTGGWVCNWRQIEEWEWYTTSNMAHLFQHLIRRANHKPKKWQGIVVEQGQLVTSQTSLKVQTGISRQSLRTCLDRLKSTGEITIQTTNIYSLISICNYKTYQDYDDKSNQVTNQPTNQRLTSEQPATNQQLTTNNNNNNGTMTNNENKKKKRASPFVPPTLEEVKAYCAENHYQVDAAEFIKYYSSAADGVWRDRDLKPVKNWKQKIIAVWSKNNGRTTKTRSNTGFDYENEPGSIEIRA